MNPLDKWVASAQNAKQKTFRSVVHIILNGISSHHDLRTEMIMKGGILMAIAYHTGRYTKDIDFSTPKHYSEFQAGQKIFIGNLENAIKLSAAELPYGIACAIQSSEVRPGVDGNYQTLHLAIGYALRSNSKTMRKLEAGQSSEVVRIDYSFNELVGDIALIDAGGEEQLQTYGQLTLVAEKLRALIQQKTGIGQRQNGSPRGQDIFDLHSLLTQSPPSWEAQVHLVELLIAKAQSRDLYIDQASMMDLEIYKKSEGRYLQLAAEIEGDLPEYEVAFGTVRKFYEELPWPVELKSPGIP
jgi:hypothetical protein